MGKGIHDAMRDHAVSGDDGQLISTLTAIARGERTPSHRAPGRPSSPEGEASSTVCAASQAGEDTKFRTSTPDRDAGIRRLREKYESIKGDRTLGWHARFRITDQLGKGGQGIVYLAESRGADGFSGRHLALKVFSPDLYPDVETYERDMGRIAGVASIVATISQGNVLDVQRFEKHDGVRMMLLKREQGYDLRKLMDPGMVRPLRDRNLCPLRVLNSVIASDEGRQNRFQPGAATSIMRACLAALDRLHSRGVVHGDVKPSNIMVTFEGETKLIDIGAAFEVTKSQQPYFCTPQYAAPEVLEHRECTPKSDLASLGYVLIELLVGRPVFAGRNIGTATERSMPMEASTGIMAQADPWLVKAKRELPGQLDGLLQSYSPRLREFCRRLIDPDASRRFATARDADLAGYQYVQELEVSKLAAHFSNDFRLWLEAVQTQETQGLSKRLRETESHPVEGRATD